MEFYLTLNFYLFWDYSIQSDIKYTCLTFRVVVKWKSRDTPQKYCTTVNIAAFTTWVLLAPSQKPVRPRRGREGIILHSGVCGLFPSLTGVELFLKLSQHTFSPVYESVRRWCTSRAHERWRDRVANKFVCGASEYIIAFNNKRNMIAKQHYTRPLVRPSVPQTGKKSPKCTRVARDIPIYKCGRRESSSSSSSTTGLGDGIISVCTKIVADRRTDGKIFQPENSETTRCAVGIGVIIHSFYARMRRDHFLSV